MENKFTNYATLALAIVFIPAILYLSLKFFPRDIYTTLGLVLTIPALVLLAVSRLQLGASFSISAQAHQLVTTGLYSKLRHPIYVFGQFIVLGLALCMHSPYLLLFWALAMPVQLFRIRREERVLEAKFGDAYRAYKARTWF